MAFLRYAEDPVGFVEAVLGRNLWHAQEEVLRLLVSREEVTVRACHSVGKTFVASCATLWWLHCREPSKVVTTAPSHRQVKDVLWRDIRRLQREAKIALPGEVRETAIKITEDTFATGFATDETDRFQGFHSSNLLIIVEEASGVPEAIFEGILGCLTAAGNRLLLIGNPLRPSGRFYQSHQVGNAARVHLSAFDSPNVAGASLPVEQGRGVSAGTVLWPEPARRELVTPKWIFDRAAEWGLDSPLYVSRVLGDFPDAADDTLLPLSWVEAAVERGRSVGDRWRNLGALGYSEVEGAMGTGAAQSDASSTGDRPRHELPAAPERVIGVDVARYGSCETVAVVREGEAVLELVAWRNTDLMATSARVAELSRLWEARVQVDEAGLGAGVVDRLKQLGVMTIGINVGSSSSAPERFALLRDEVFWQLRDRFREGRIAIPDDDRLLRQLTALRFGYTSRGQIQVESKDAMRDRGEVSPDRADGLALSFVMPPGGFFLVMAGPLRRVGTPFRRS